jgi:hypothetical protein
MPDCVESIFDDQFSAIIAACFIVTKPLSKCHSGQIPFHQVPSRRGRRSHAKFVFPFALRIGLRQEERPRAQAPARRWHRAVLHPLELRAHLAALIPPLLLHRHHLRARGGALSPAAGRHLREGIPGGCQTHRRRIRLPVRERLQRGATIRLWVESIEGLRGGRPGRPDPRLLRSSTRRMGAMPGATPEKKYDRATLRGWADALAESDYPSGACEVVSTLINLSQAAEQLQGEVGVYLRARLDEATWPADPEIMHAVRGVRASYPQAHWWWWPERA